MAAKSIRLTADSVEKISDLKSKDQSVLEFVRDLIEKEHREKEHRASAVAYRDNLQQNPDEKTALEIWETAPLMTEIQSKKP
jgi:predicted CopG family antitoxin